MSEIKRGFIDGAFDFFHYGHVFALFQSKKKCKILCAATHSNTEIHNAKGTSPIFNYDERYLLLNNCKFIDVLCDKVPYNTTIDILNMFNCEKFFHGDDNINVYPICNIKNENRLEIYNRTIGVSTSNILKRIEQFKKKLKVETNKDLIYLKYLFNMIDVNINIKKIDTKNIVILKCSWDILNINHINLINNIKKKYPNHLLYIDMISIDNSYDIFNKYEMAITILSLKNIDKVLIYQDTTLLKFNTNTILINTDLNTGILDETFNHEIDNIRKYKFDLLNNIDINLYYNKIEKLKIQNNKVKLKDYHKILKRQFSDILLFIKNISITIKENDIIIFDIDEVCLNNLMYNNLEIEFENDIYSYENGLIPLNNECMALFNYIHKKNIKYSFITGRKDYIRQITIDNLLLVKLNKYTHLYTCDNDYIQTNVHTYKEDCREKIINQGYNIISCIGDQISDITGKHTGTPFLIFNPYYKLSYV